ncbi:MAG: hypothetical protein LAO07_21455, partial [Acidobacteriia bacterium]|nr:hypothetical protein [Terriglobia bacterium]
HYDETQKAQDRPIEKKETYRWLTTVDDLNEAAAYLPETELIAVGDRESEMFELFDHRRRKAPRVHLLVRAKHNRCLEEDSRKLFDHLEALPVMSQARIEVPRQREKKSKPSKPGRIALPARTAHVDVKWDKVTLSPPATTQTRNLQPVEIYALSVVEHDPPEGTKALRWVLLTTVPMVASLITGPGAKGHHGLPGSPGGRDLHAGLGILTTGMYFTSAYFAIRAPKIPDTKSHGLIRLHKALAWIHGPGMILTPILGAIAFSQLSNGERVHGIAKYHSWAAYTTAGAYGAAILSVTLK